MNRRLTPAEFDVLLQQQGGRCAICRKEDTGRSESSRLAIDHCHKTTVVRGLLCHRCNTMIGLAMDSVETLRAAIAYLDAAHE